MNNESTLNDCYRIGGSYFPVPDEDTSKGSENGPQSLVSQSDKQKAPRLNASDGYGPTVKGKEGRAFPTSGNSQASADEQPVFAGDKDPTLGVSLLSGQIVSTDNHRVEPHPRDADDDKIHARVNGKRKPADAKENRL